MALVTINGLTAYETQRRAPRSGAWAWDLRVDTEGPISGRATISVDDGAVVNVGTVVRTGVFAGVAQVQVVAGAAGMGLPATPRHYAGTTVGMVLGDLLRDAGEALAASADPAVLRTQVAGWTTLAWPVGSVLGRLLAAAAPAAVWRSLADGTVWVGADAFADSGVDPDTYQVVEERAEDGISVVSVDRPALFQPGTSFEGRRVAMVQDDDASGGGVTSRLWFEDAAAPQAGRDLAAFQALVRGTPRGVDYAGRYPARVVSQSGGTVHVVADDARIGDLGDVPLFNQAGESVSGVVGGRVLVGWSGPDGTGVYAEGFDGRQSSVAERVLGGDSVYVGGKDGAQPAALGNATQEALDILVAAINGKPGGSPVPPLPPILAARARVA